MITCTYCGYKCPDDAQICPNCGKPIIRLTVDAEPDYNELAKALLRETEQKEPISHKHAIIASCAVLLLALVAYSFFAR
ncbi:MAG: zinc-ribbon domain [Firmicutes bacterium]|nr:zinc-ribbon domain [Bacillota bacterium]